MVINFKEVIAITDPSDYQFFWKKNLEDISPLCGATDAPV